MGCMINLRKMDQEFCVEFVKEGSLGRRDSGVLSPFFFFSEGGKGGNISRAV